MSRSNNNKGKSTGTEALGLATKEASDVPVMKGGSKGGGSTFGKMEEVTSLLQYPKPQIVNSPWGESYLGSRTRAIPADAIQAIISQWVFRLRGYHASGTTTAGQPNFYADAENLLLNWYLYGRQQGKAALKYKHTPLTLNDYTRVEDFWNIFHDTGADLVALANLEKLIQFNQALSSLETYIPEKMSRAKRLYRRWAAIFAPEKLRTQAIKDGMIVYVHGAGPMHIRFWDLSHNVMYGGSADYTDLTADESELITDNTKFGQFLDNIEKGLWVLEGNVTYDANAAADVTAIKDLCDMLNDVAGGTYKQGAPSWYSYPGYLADPHLFNDYYTRALAANDTKGVGANQITCFPVAGATDPSENILVAGYGKPDEDTTISDDFTLFGAPKFGLLDSTAGLRYTDDTNEWMLFGTSVPARFVVDNKFFAKYDQYTREDGWVETAVGATYFDLGDGADIRVLINSFHPWMRHIHWPHLFAAQLTTTLEYRWIDIIKADYGFYVPASDLCAHHALALADMFKVPYIM